MSQLEYKLLAIENVREELNLSAEASEKIVARAAELNQQLSDEVKASFPDGPMSFNRDVFDEIVAMLRDGQQELLDLLSEDQLTRLKEIRYQRMGPTMFLEDQVVEALNLSGEQQSALDKIMEPYQQEVQYTVLKVRGTRDPAKVREAMLGLKNKKLAAIDEVLTEEQRATVNGLRGKEFEFPPGNEF